jgi:hypothetical protein
MTSCHTPSKKKSHNLEILNQFMNSNMKICLHFSWTESVTDLICTHNCQSPSVHLPVHPNASPKRWTADKLLKKRRSFYKANQGKIVHFAATCTGSSPIQLISPLLTLQEKYWHCDNNEIVTSDYGMLDNKNIFWNCSADLSAWVCWRKTDSVGVCESACMCINDAQYIKQLNTFNEINSLDNILCGLSNLFEHCKNTFTIQTTQRLSPHKFTIVS